MSSSGLRHSPKSQYRTRRNNGCLLRAASISGMDLSMVILDSSGAPFGTWCSCPVVPNQLHVSKCPLEMRFGAASYSRQVNVAWKLLKVPRYDLGLLQWWGQYSSKYQPPRQHALFAVQVPSSVGRNNLSLTSSLPFTITARKSAFHFFELPALELTLAYCIKLRFLYYGQRRPVFGAKSVGLHDKNKNYLVLPNPVFRGEIIEHVVQTRVPAPPFSN
jgi:hypothetical protein